MTVNPEAYPMIFGPNHGAKRSYQINNYNLIQTNLLILPIEEQCGLLRKIKYDWYNISDYVASVIIEWWRDDYILCYDFFIKEKYRGHGLSHQIVEFFISLGVNHLSVTPDNTIAQKLYQKHGFDFNGKLNGTLLEMERN